MEAARKPNLKLAERVLPKALYEAIEFVFNQGLEGTSLVGGTCLSGFYSGHRRSDDMDLFSNKDADFRAAVLAVKNLSRIGVEFSNQTQSQQYFHANCRLKGHQFTVDVVQDENLFKVGSFHEFKNLKLANLETLLKMKAATLVSRCSEKDLSDLLWLFEEFPQIKIEELVSLGSEIDRGVNAESMLASVGGTELRVGACDFSLKNKSAEVVFEEISDLKIRITSALKKYLEDQPAPLLGQLVRKLKN